jgi:tRNA(Ile)-lysidine synthetase-like protein
MSLSSLLTFWFPNQNYQDFWFDGSKDHEINELFNDLLKENEKTITDPRNFSDRELLGLIILYDQITRNIGRTQVVNFTNPYRNDQIAFKLAKYIMDNDKDNIFSFNERMFVLLPYRHSRMTENLDFVMKKLHEYEEKERFTVTEFKLLGKFKLATLKDYGEVTDTIQVIMNQIDKHPVYNDTIHDDICRSFSPKAIDSKIESMVLYKSVEKFVVNNKITRVAISLSGGVDSNVLMYILHHLKLTNKIETFVAIHVDYVMRPESGIEAKYLIEVCQYLGIPMITRRIEHMNDNEKDITRPFYEIETKNIRFELYRYVMSKYGVQGICLGHHEDDLVENVFMNVLKGKDILDLFVMTPKCTVDDVQLLRPMLNHPKKDIYELAHMFCIMYFKDTTPDWCFRGTIRRQLFPIIEKFDSALLSNLILIGKRSNEWRNVIEQIAIAPIINTLKKGKCGFSIEMSGNFTNLPNVYWTQLFTNLFHKQGIKMITHKNLEHFIDWVKNGKASLCRFSNDLTVCILENKLYFFFSKIMCTEKKNMFVNFTEKEKSSHILSRWKISIEPTLEHIDEPMTYDNLIDGHFVYTEPINKKSEFTIGFTLDSKDHTKKLFSKLKKMSSSVPKCTSGVDNESKYVKITLDWLSNS